MSARGAESHGDPECASIAPAASSLPIVISGAGVASFEELASQSKSSVSSTTGPFPLQFGHVQTQKIQSGATGPWPVLPPALLQVHPQHQSPCNIAPDLPWPAHMPVLPMLAASSQATPATQARRSQDRDPFELLLDVLQDRIPTTQPPAEPAAADHMQPPGSEPADAAGSSEAMLRAGSKRSESPSLARDDAEAPREKRKAGRPIAYSGDPDASHLSIEERRLIKRRISNRESAQRVRQRKQDDNEEKLGELDRLKSRHDSMQEHVRDVDQQYAALYSHLQHLTAKCHAAEAAQQRLLGENSMLRQMLRSTFTQYVGVQRPQALPSLQLPPQLLHPFTGLPSFSSSHACHPTRGPL